MKQVDIKGFEDYQITDDGRVWSKNSKKYLKPSSINGYMVVSLYKNSRQKQRLVHRLVAEAFIPNTDNLPEVNHKDENKNNNAVENLEWCTPVYNINYGERTNKQKDSISKKIYKYSIDGKLVGVYKSATEAERLNIGYNHRSISAACNGKIKIYKGYKWSFKPM